MTGGYARIRRRRRPRGPPGPGGRGIDAAASVPRRRGPLLVPAQAVADRSVGEPRLRLGAERRGQGGGGREGARGGAAAPSRLGPAAPLPAHVLRPPRGPARRGDEPARPAVGSGERGP